MDSVAASNVGLLGVDVLCMTANLYLTDCLVTDRHNMLVSKAVLACVHYIALQCNISS